MNLATLEQIVGPINRGQLATSFKTFYEPATGGDEQAYFTESEAGYKPPPLTEDLTHLNAKGTKKMSEAGKAIWQRMKPSERRRRHRMLSEAGKIGGKATRDIRHMHGV